MRLRLFSSVLAICAVAVPAAAQSSDDGIGFRAYGLYDWVSLSASESFDATFGETRISGFGAGAEVLDVWKGLFGRVAFSRMTKEEGTRVFVVDGLVIPTNVGLEVEMTPLEFGAGWRHALDPDDRYVVYGGMSGLRMTYKETSEFAESGDDVDESFNGYAVFAGLDVLAAPFVFGGVEVQYRSVPDAIGAGGVSAVFGEDDLGGVVFRVLFGIRR
jgi:hypothetical protein